jgi:lactate permease
MDRPAWAAEDEMSFLLILLSFLPFALILFLMLGLRWNLMQTGLAAWGLTFLLAVAAFGAGLPLIAVSQARAIFLALDVLYIVWGALLFYGVCEEAGVVQAIGRGFVAAIPSQNLRALALAWAFASFLQGAGGFGVPVVITAPLLVETGFSPLQAVLLPSIGHAWAVTFGSLGTSFQALMTASSLPAGALAGPSAILLGGVCLLSGVMIGLLASERGAFLRILPAIVLVGFIMAGVQYLLAVHGLWQIGSLGGGLAGLGAIFGMVWLAGRGKKSLTQPPDGKFLWGLAGYALLMALIVCAQWIPPLHAALQSVQWRTTFPQTVTSLGFIAAAEESKAIAPLGHPGALLIYAAVAAALLFAGLGYLEKSSPSIVLRNTARRAVPVSIGILLMVGISTIFSQSGMMARLADGIGTATGAAFPAVAPLLGAMGAFLTGSNTNSNLLFAPLQQRMAQTLGLPERILLAAQTAGGAVGSVVSPAKVGLGSNALRGSPGEGEVMRRLLIPIAILLIAISFLTLLML